MRAAFCFMAVCISGCSPELLIGGLLADGGPDGSVRDAGALDATPADASAVDAADADAGACSSRPCTRDAGVVCDIVSQCGCECEQACIGISGSERVCGTPGSLGPGESCTNAFDCAGGLGCLPPGNGVCTPYCTSGADCASSPCLLPGGVGTVPEHPVGLCIWPCNLVTGGGCPGELVCMTVVFVDDRDGLSDRASSICIPPGNVAIDEPCAENYLDPDSYCSPGLACINTDCARVCNPRSPDCPGATSCDTESLTYEVRVSGVLFGVCL